MSAIDPIESAAKFALDNAEAEGVPELQCVAATHNDSGGLILVLPSHPLMTAFIQELDQLEYEPLEDLKTARHRLRAAHKLYQARVIRRVMNANDIPGLTPLSDILIARAAGGHWHKVVMKLEAEKKIINQRERNRRAIVRHRLRSMGLAC